MKRVDYQTIKAFVVQRNLSVQYIILADRYLLFAIDGLLALETILPMDGSAEQLDFESTIKLTGNKPLNQQSPFASKNFGAKKLYKREHGVKATVTPGVNTILFTIPYAWVKLIGLELLYGTEGDTVDLLVLDSTTGTYTTIPNAVLNQFGYSVNVAVGEYEENSVYDADLYQGMQIKLVYNSASVGNKLIGINFNLNEVK